MIAHTEPLIALARTCRLDLPRNLYGATEVAQRMKQEAAYLRGARSVQIGHPSARTIRERLRLIKSDALRQQNERIANMV